MKEIVVLGSTGSIGTNVLQVAKHLADQIQVKVIAAKQNIDLLEKQALEFRPQLIAVYDKEKARELQKRLPRFRVVGGMEGLLEATASDCDLIVSAMVGSIGILPTIHAIETGKDVALANKEVLVAAGRYVMDLARQKKVNLIPIDSEHSAIFQCLQGKPEVSRLILTASGGPFRNRKELGSITLEEALGHPTWKMGVKNTIDSSTLMNKGLEVIEAHYLFDVPVQDIEVVIHPQSLVHSFVECVDGSLLAQISEPSMIMPIQYALTYPKREKGLLQPFDFTKFPKFEFYPPDNHKFKCLSLAYEALRAGGTMPCFMNGANEVLVERFVRGEIAWLSIGEKLENLMSSYCSKKDYTVHDIFAIDELAKAKAREI